MGLGVSGWEGGGRRDVYTQLIKFVGSNLHLPQGTHQGLIPPTYKKIMGLVSANFRLKGEEGGGRMKV